MALLTSDMPLSAALEQYPTLIPLVSRFGIRLGQGDKSVVSVCTEHAVDAEFLLTLMNTYLFEAYFPEQKLKSFHVTQIIDYLTKTNTYYLQSQVPNIERHLVMLIASSDGGSKNLALIGRFFARFKESLMSAIAYDDHEWFPYCLALGSGDAATNSQSSHRRVAISDANDGDPAVNLLCDLRSILIRHLNEQYNDNLAYAVIFGIDSLERDIRQHNRIRNKILTPIIRVLCCR